MHPYRLVALAVIAMFALGFSRLLADTGVRDEHAPADVPFDLITRAACTAIADPLAEALEVSLVPGSAVHDGYAVCELSAHRSAGMSAEQSVAHARAVFGMLSWRMVEASSSGEFVYERSPVRCALSVDELVNVTCRRDSEGEPI